MFGTSTPDQKTKKRDLSSPEIDLESETKLQRFCNSSPEVPAPISEMADSKQSNLTLDQDAIMSISVALSDTIQSNV